MAGKKNAPAKVDSLDGGGQEKAPEGDGAVKERTDSISLLEEIPAVKDYLNRIGAESRSLKTAVVNEWVGGYKNEKAIVKFTESGLVTGPDEHLPTEAEAEKIRAAIQTVKFPKLLKLKEMVTVPEEVEKADPKNVFIFRDSEQKIVMVQVRCENDRGERFFLPLTYWSDSIWRRCEPGDTLPLYNLDRIENQTTAFIHEGAGSAKYCQWLVDQRDDEAKQALRNHPWGEELQSAVHLAWVGGALSPERTNWSALKKAGIKVAYVIADNDSPGRAAVPDIAFQLRMPTYAVMFSDEWPSGFDLKDPFPEKMFGKIDGKLHYTGPSFFDCTVPAVWMTDKLKVEKGPPQYKLRDHAKGVWIHVPDIDQYVAKRDPRIMFPASVLNKKLRPFSHVANTASYIDAAFDRETFKLCYRPDKTEERIVYDGGFPAINRHVPTSIKSEPGDPEPFLEFLRYMVPIPEEREVVMRWCATLIAKPENRIEFALLLISEAQGVGKTTLGSAVLAPLVGMDNVSFPSESEIGSEFTSWIANKRLAIISEIYAGRSWKLANTIKAKITDADISVNEKYLAPYKVQNWCHFFASSNSLNAIKVADDDRRWYCPTLTEVKWERSKFDRLHAWLRSGGLGIVKQWAEDQPEEFYFRRGDRAPMTERKRRMISESRSEGQQAAFEIGEMIAGWSRSGDEGAAVPAAIGMKDVSRWVRDRAEGRVFDSELELKRGVKAAGCKEWPERIKINGAMQYVLVNEPLLAEVQGMEPKEARERIRNCLVDLEREARI